MQLTIMKTQYERVHLTDTQITEVAKAKLERMLYPGEYLRKDGDKWIVKQDDPHHYHGSVGEVYVRDATELDKAIFKVLDHL